MTENLSQIDIETPHPISTGSLAAGLYLVATPIGNLGDMTFRAVDVLRMADEIVCEDTRISAKLFQAFSIPKKKLTVYNDHSTEKDRAVILQKIKEGQRIALISDAGTPLVSDPGFKLVRACAEQGLFMTSLPGANAVLTALQLSALPSDSFSFIGFLPPKTVARKKVFEIWKDVPATLLAYETGPRLLDSLKDALDVLGDRQACIARELTKRFEEIRRDSLSVLIEKIEKNGEPKGEIVLVIGAALEDSVSEEDMVKALKKALKTMSVKGASVEVSSKTGWPKKDVYDAALRLKKT